MSERNVLSPILHGGKVYRPGDVIDLDDAEAKELEAAGAVEPAPKAKPAKTQDGKGGKG